MTYVVVAPGGVSGFDFLWLALVVVIDLSSYGAGRRLLLMLTHVGPASKVSSRPTRTSVEKP